MAAKSEKYHRDDLRGDLLRAGRRYIAEKGHHSLSVRTLAQSVGVSPGAPYHHFRDRRALLLALASEGYEELFGAAHAFVEPGRTPEETLLEMGLQFVNFAVSSPRLLELMYESELTSPAVDPVLVKYQDIGHAALIKPLREALTELDENEIGLRGLAYWSSIYGFASLRRKHMIEKIEPPDMAQDQVVRRVISLAVSAALRIESGRPAA
ncbi:TetR/AcrR family transcriptional regulator [Croceicoccus marinus]|uniref:TetR family transcriptional regulator n=1 Tax=Croceicoccus marinus TaxID=450378 RepID=A0A1Z1FGN1_9SPHN|nr:TetR/AcrR family transcriptional regulator [Croceicoccus marinus]ARU17958.1 TetR family transcriptional regulator [Croceicoccus marinus]QNE07461.1 TetR/AcrR family transcriptional regulator [Croceicoccus marinus]